MVRMLGMIFFPVSQELNITDIFETSNCKITYMFSLGCNTRHFQAIITVLASGHLSSGVYSEWNDVI